MEYPINLKAANRRDGVDRLHILIMSADGQTRRLSLTAGFFWLIGISAALIVGALAVTAHLLTGYVVEIDRLKDRLDFVERSAQMSDYVRSVASAPEEARLVLELLDRAVLMADADSDDLELVGVPDDEEEPAVPSETNESATGETGEPRPAPSPQDAAWAAFHALLPAVPSPAPVDVDEFKLSVNGQFSFMLLQNDAPGQRVRGRSVTVFAVAGPDDESVTLIASPEMDLTELEQGWEVGSRYNIIASKVVRGQIAVPEGSQVLSAEVLAWDEDDKSLIFRKKIKIEGR